MTTTTRTSFAQSVQDFSAQARVLMTRLNVYYAGAALLAVVNLVLLAQILFAWRAADSQNATAIEQQTVAMKTAEIAKKPLEGLDGKLVTATKDADQFYLKRLPVTYSEVVAELGALTKQQGVKLTRVQYADSPDLEGSTGALTEIRMDASLNGDYRPLVLFINSLERDKMFFLIRGVTLAGQSNGMVGLRLGLTTYLRQPTNAAEAARAEASAATDSKKEGSPALPKGGAAR
jgi:hypothetical protein